MTRLAGAQARLDMLGMPASPAIADFQFSLGDPAPPADFPAPLQALWWAAHEDWEQAHALVQDASGPDAAWVHAHLHRVEGDDGNAGYWYRRAGKPRGAGDLAREREAIVAALVE